MRLTNARPDGDDRELEKVTGETGHPQLPEGDTLLPGLEAHDIAARLEALTRSAAKATPAQGESTEATDLPAPPAPQAIPATLASGPVGAPAGTPPLSVMPEPGDVLYHRQSSITRLPPPPPPTPEGEASLGDVGEVTYKQPPATAPSGKVTIKKSSEKKRRFGRKAKHAGDDGSPSAPPAGETGRAAAAATTPAPTAKAKADAKADAAAPSLPREPGLAPRREESLPPPVPEPEIDDHQLLVDKEGGPRHTGQPLGELLIGRGLVSEDELRKALSTQTGSGKRLGNILVELGLLTERGLVEVLAEQLQMEIADVATMQLDREVVHMLAEYDARRLVAIPVRRDGAWIDVAVSDPLGENLRDELIDLLKHPVRLLFATRTDIETAVNKMYVPDLDLGDALRMFEARLTTRRTKRSEDATVTTVVDENAPVVKVVNLILEQAVRARASDVHIEPMEELVRVRVRTDGALHQVMTLPGPMGPSLISRIKVMSDMNIVERRKPQDGQLMATVAGRELDVRVSTTPTVFGEKCVLRVLDKTKAVIDLPRLGMAPETYARYSDLIRSPYGMVICAGPTGSGKTTTLYATLTAINSDDINVVTVEDPVEYVFPAINQIQINEAGGLTFANGLRAILRQDPDAILVGEIRDVETARIAVQAALTGHFVMSSLHATDATSALHRFMDMGIEPFLIASSLLGVVGQRLIRKVCPHCITDYTPTPDELAFYERGGGDPAKTQFVAGAGCAFCGETGYYDRIGIYEVLAVTDEFKQLIVGNASHAELRELAMGQGMKTLREQAVELVTQDKTTIAEVLRTVYVL